jgi:glycerophosphoryl diester phosphodiesterase
MAVLPAFLHQLIGCIRPAKGSLETGVSEPLLRHGPSLLGWQTGWTFFRPEKGFLENRVSVWVVAHRGASGHAPENTLAAFRKAVELGARFIETDLQLTRDARLIAIHDTTLDRTTNGHGQVHSLTLEQIRALDAGAWFDSRGPVSYAGEHVPTLDEILSFSQEHDVNFYLEIKSGAAWGVEHAVVAAVRDANASARVVILSFDAAILDSVYRLDGMMMTGFLCEHPSSDLVERAVRLGARQLAPRGDLITSALVKKAHDAGLQVVAWTINDPEQMRRLMDAGVDGIMTDFPDVLVRVVKESGG